MKSPMYALVAVAALLVTQDANASECNTFTITKFLLDSDVVKCTVATGLTPLSPPDADVLAKVCTNSACQSMLASLKKLGLGDCTVGGVAVESAFLTPIDVYCAATTPSAAPAAGAKSAAVTLRQAALASTFATVAVAVSLA